MPKVSIVILNWNGKKFLKNCLTSLSKINYPNYEIIVVDNASTDGSVPYIKNNFPKVRLLENKKNQGFAQGNNSGFKLAKGEYILFLNNDTKVTPNFLTEMISDFKGDPKIGCIQPQIRVMRESNLIDEVGSYISFTGFLYHFGYRKPYDLKKYNVKREIFSAKGACIIFPRKVLNKIGVFDRDFFIFFEESDLCFRVWLSGYKVIYEPRSLIYHVVGGDTISSDKYKYERRIYLTFKNMNCSYIKNFGTRNLITVFPIFLLVQFVIIINFAIRLKFGLVKSALAAYLWNMVNIRHSFLKRKIIQKKIRKVSDKEINKFIKKSPNFNYYYYSLFKTTQEYKD